MVLQSQVLSEDRASAAALRHIKQEKATCTLGRSFLLIRL